MSEKDSNGEEKIEQSEPLPNNNQEGQKNTLYNCAECSSLIEISSIDENDNMVKYKCLGDKEKHEKTIKIKEYLEKMVQFNNKALNEDICPTHNDTQNKYVSYCFDCNKHLCPKCLQDRTHINHYKNNIIEIKPIQQECDIVKKIIDDYEEKIKKLQIEKDNTIKKLEETLENNKTQENKKIDKKIEDCDNEDKNELKNNVEKHQTDKDAIRKKYQKEIKLRNEQLKIEDKETKNKYTLMKEKEKIYSQYKIEE